MLDLARVQRGVIALEAKGIRGDDLGCVVSLDTKTVTEQGEFEGYASTFGNEDQGGDIVMSGAFAKSISKGVNKIKMFRDHDRTKIVGVWSEMTENNKGLKVRGQLLLDTALGKETYVLLKAGAVDGLSIGFRTIKDHYDQARPMIRYLDEVDLKEVSIVPFGMNERALITGVKGNLPSEREFEAWLMRDAGFTAQQAKAIIADGFKALKGKRDAAGGEAEALIGLLNRAQAALK